MKLKEFEVTKEKKILTWLIVSKPFLENTPFLQPSHFSNTYGSKILTWCRNFNATYNDAPGEHIMDTYIREAETFGLDEDEKEYMEKLLTNLSGEWEKRKEFNLAAALDLAVDFANDKNSEILQENIKSAIETHNTEEVQKLTDEFKLVTLEKAAKTGEDPFNDLEGWEEAFDDDQQEVLFELPGVWGEFMGEQLYRESLLGVLAAEKSGKSWILTEMGSRALRCGRSVALFEAGDMTKNQRYFRIAQYYARLPRKRKLPGKDIEEFIDVKWPLDFEGNFENKRLKNLTKAEAIETVKKQAKRLEKNGGKLRQAYYTTSTLTFSEIERKLLEWEAQDGFQPDVILIDYPDIMLAENSKQEVRHQENLKWKMARHLSQKYHACVIMCTQADADSYGKEWLVLKNFSESKTKYAHVTAFIGLNRNEEDETNNRIRLNYLMPPREGSKHPPIKILQCLECGQPYLKSAWAKKRPADSEMTDDEGNYTNLKSDKSGKALKKGANGEIVRKYFIDNPVHYSFKDAVKTSGLSDDRCRKIRHELVVEGKI